jgi:hypothetical protein
MAAGLPVKTSWAANDVFTSAGANDLAGTVNLLGLSTVTATAAGTTVLTVASNRKQTSTGTTTQTVTLPVVSTLSLGDTFEINNSSTGVVTVQSSGANSVLAMAAGTRAVFTCVLITGTTAASWSTPAAASSAGALTLVKTGTITSAVNSGTTFDGVFTSAYRNYLVLMTDLIGSGSADLLLQTRIAGVTSATGVYYGSRSVLGSSGAVVNTQVAAGTSSNIVNIDPSGNSSNMQLWFSSVAVAKRPTWNGTGFEVPTSGSVTEGYSSATAAAIDGFILSVASGTFSGLIKVYGVSN